MEFWRRSGSGTLSEILGSSALASDRFIRTVGWHRTAAQELEKYNESELSVLDAYAEGVNVYIEQKSNHSSYLCEPAGNGSLGSFKQRIKASPGSYYGVCGSGIH
jgi:acyl-homoserine lactone acylase PvdQ